MADYKKKKINKKIAIKSKKENYAEREIKMKNSSSARKEISTKQKSNLRVINGFKKYRQIAFILITILIALILLVYNILLSFYPVGLIEYFTTVYKTSGGTNFSVSELSGSQIINCEQKNGYFYLVTKTDIKAFSNNCKPISSVSHGFANPVICTSDTRMLVYGQGERSVKIYNLDKKLNEISFDSSVLCADVSNSGGYAVVTSAVGYDCAVFVYNKHHKKIYEWYCSDGIINSVKLSNNGKQLFLSTVSSENGKFKSKIINLEFDSADPVSKFEFNGEIIYKLFSVSNNQIYAVFEDNVRHINFKSGAILENKSEFTNKFADFCEDKMIVLSNLTANEERNSLSLISKKGTIETKINLDYSVNNLVYKNGHIYVLSDSKIYCIDKNGGVIYSADSSFDLKYISVLSNRQIIGISNTSLSKIELTKAEE